MDSLEQVCSLKRSELTLLSICGYTEADFFIDLNVSMLPIEIYTCYKREYMFLYVSTNYSLLWFECYQTLTTAINQLRVKNTGGNE